LHPQWTHDVIQREIIPSCIKKGLWRGELALLTRDGREIPTLTVGVGCKDANGKMNFLAVIMRDITDRKKAEEALREGEERYRILAERNPHGIQVIDQTGIITYVNPAYQKMLGHTKEELLGKHIVDLLEPASRRPELHEYLSLLVKEQPEPTVYFQQNRRKDGEIIEQAVNWNYSRDNKGNVVGFISVITDITERKQAEVELQLINEQLDAVIFNMPIGVAILEGSEFKYVKINRTLADINGLSVEDHIGRPLAEVIPHAAKDIIPRLRKVWKSNKTSPQYEFSTRLPKDPGRGKYFIDCFFPIEGKDGKIKAIGTTVLDITNRKESELILKESHDLLEHCVEKRTKELGKSEKDLIRQKRILEEKNIALSEIVAQIEIEKNKIKENITANVDELLMPSLKSLKRKGTRLDRRHIDLLEKNLRELSSTFGKKISEKKWNLTPKEIKICNLIRNGLSNKEIAGLFNTSLRTIESHRNNIRKKLGISGKAVNLTTYLQFF